MDESIKKIADLLQNTYKEPQAFNAKEIMTMTTNMVNKINLRSSRMVLFVFNFLFII